MKTINIGGVPEHFNYPWHYAIQHNLFADKDINLNWTNVKGGSGAMCTMLEQGQLDFALVLTEGIVKHIHKGGKSRIVQLYVKSPLTWGIHSRPNSNLLASDLSKARIARSRVGSGSHLMAYVHAQQKGYTISEQNFETVGNIDGAMDAFRTNTADILLWEKFLTQPYINNGHAERIGLCVSPWPCFVLVASEGAQKDLETIDRISKGIIQSVEAISEQQDTIEQIAKMYELKTEQVAEWYSSLEWQTSPWVSKKMLHNVITTLDRVNLLGTQPLLPYEMCVENARLY